jgi:hypothetical protein
MIIKRGHSFGFKRPTAVHQRFFLASAVRHEMFIEPKSHFYQKSRNASNEPPPAKQVFRKSRRSPMPLILYFVARSARAAFLNQAG